MAPWSTKKRVTFWRKKKKPVVAEVAEEKAEAAEFSGGSSTITETKKRITTKSNVKQVRFSEKDAEAEEEVVVRDNMAEKNRLKASDVAKKEAVGGGMKTKEKTVAAAAVGAENLAKKEAVGGGGMKTKEKAASAAAVGAENLAKKEAVVGRRMEVKEKAVAAAAVGAETTGGITVTEMQGKNTTKRDVTLKELEVAKEEVAARNSTTSAMITQASALAEEEAVGGTGATLGDMEVALRSIKKPSPVPPPSQHTDIHGNARKDGGASSVEQRDTPIKAKSPVEILSSRSPTSQFEYDIMDATHKTLDFDYLHRSRSFPQLDDNKSISSDESLLERDDESFLSYGVATYVSTQTKAQDNEFSACVNDVLSPMEWATDYLFCKMKCAFPNMVEDMNEILSNDLHHLVFQAEEEEEGQEVEALIPLDEEGGDNRGEEAEGNQGEEDEEAENKQGEGPVEVLLGPCAVEQREGRVGKYNGGVDEQGDDETGEEIVVVDRQMNSSEVEVVSGRWAEKQAQFENASYSPSAGFVLRKDGRLPELSEDEVLIRVDAATISTRDRLERHRRDSTEELKDEVWVPGHEIVGHVVCAGANAKFLLDKRVAVVLPYGGGCSQYVRIDAKDVIALPEEAGSNNDVVTLLSTYMTAHQCLESVAGIEPEEDEDVESHVESNVGSHVESNAESNVESKEADDAGQEQERSRLFGKNVLIVGAGSPIGLALVDLARNAGATVYTELPNISLLDAIRWRGIMDLIIDTVLDLDNNPSFYKVMKTRARLVRMNITSCEKKYAPSRPLEGQGEQGIGLLNRYKERVINDKAIEYDALHSFNEDKELFTEDLAYLLDLLKNGKIGPKFSPQVGFDKLEGEWEKLMAGRGTNCGIVVVSPWTFGFTTVRG